MSTTLKNTITLQELHQFDIYSKEYSNKSQIANNIFVLKKQIEELTKQLESDKKILLEFMATEKVEKIVDDIYNTKITLVNSSTRKSFDTTNFKKDHMDLFEKYQKDVTVKETLRIEL